MIHYSPLFIGHGSPMNAIEKNSYTTFLRHLGESMPKPRAVVVISAHWQSDGTFITGAEQPAQIYDFGGFPRELRELRYTPAGSPELAREIAQQVEGVAIDHQRGIDHGAWSIVKNIYPHGDVPLIQISLDYRRSPRQLALLGSSLAPFCNERVLCIGSGNLIHNLREISGDTDAAPFDWAIEMDHWFKEKLEIGAIDDLFEYRQILPHYARAVPTQEHLDPLFVILGMKKSSDRITTLYESIQNGSISMRSIAVGPCMG